MSLQVEKLEKNMAKLTIEASAEEFERPFKKHIKRTRIKLIFKVFVKERHLVL